MEQEERTKRNFGGGIMKTMEIVRKLISQPFGNLEEFTKELNRLCNMVETENARLTEQLENSVQLPCKVGDTVYVLYNGRVERGKIAWFKVMKTTIQYRVCNLALPYEKGKAYCFTKVFATQPEAEARLKELDKEIENEIHGE